MIGTVSRYGVTVCPDAATVGPNIGAVERYGATVEPKIGDVGQFEGSKRAKVTKNRHFREGFKLFCRVEAWDCLSGLARKL